MQQIPFVECLIGQSSGFSMSVIDMTRTKADVIRQAVMRSEIEAVARMSVEQKDKLALRIVKLKQVETLYGTQLDAFVAGIAAAVHCTQGPPGQSPYTYRHY